jgi:hypothetical protein
VTLSRGFTGELNIIARQKENLKEVEGEWLRMLYGRVNFIKVYDVHIVNIAVRLL